MKYAFYNDPSHGWLKVSIQEIDKLAICQDISSNSFISPCGKYAYLERDVDCQLFIKAALEADWFDCFDAIRKCTKMFSSNSPSFIRDLDSFSSYKDNDCLKFCLSQSFEL